MGQQGVGDVMDISTELSMDLGPGADEDWLENLLDLDSPEAAQAMFGTSAEVGRLQREFRQRAAFLLKVLVFSVARGGTAPRVSDLCFEMNFSSFYHKDL